MTEQFDAVGRTSLYLPSPCFFSFEDKSGLAALSGSYYYLELIMTAKEKVLNMLKTKGAKGVSVWDFPAGFRLAARIADWRASGKEIVMINEKNSVNSGSHARYILER
jgi:hypothetical protein